VPANALANDSRPWTHGFRRFGLAVRLVACFVSITFVSAVVPWVEKWKPENNLLWVANGLFLAYLLLAPRWRWPAYLMTGFLALSVRAFFMPTGWSLILLYNLLDMVEVGTAALLLRPRTMELPRFTERAYLIRFVAYGVLAGPLLAGAVYALVIPFWGLPVPPHPFLNWSAADCLGIAIGTPAFVAVFRTRLRNAVDWRKQWFYPALLLLVAVAAFTQNTVPLFYLIYPLLVVVLVRLGLGYASLLTLFVTAIAGWLTIHGRGPFANPDLAHPAVPALNLQIAITSAMLLIYAVSIVLESRNSIERHLEKIVSLHALVTENSRDAIILADFHGRRTYASSAVERMIGWPPAEFARITSLELVHPDDLKRAKATVRGLRTGAEGAMLECRVRKYNGDYIWVEANLRLVRDAKTGAPSGILNIVRDVTERKLAEESRAFHNSLIRAINEASPDAILVVNSEGNVVSYNRRFTEVWQIARPGGLAILDEDSIPISDGRLLAEVAGKVKDSETFVKRVRELYADPDAIDQCEILLKDGRTVERYSTCLRSQVGQNLGRVWFFRDISGRKVAEAKLQDAYKAVEALAATDALTGLANRRRFDQVLQTEWRRALRDCRPLSLLMIDADLFKSYNDTYGHPSGDSCLKQIAETTQDVVARPGDVAARFGGEEFAVILPNTDSNGALQLGARILEAIRSRGLPHSTRSGGIVTVSIGCATVVPRLGQPAVNLVEAADDALYEAKKRGRDQLVAADPAIEFRRKSAHDHEELAERTAGRLA